MTVNRKILVLWIIVAVAALIPAISWGMIASNNIPLDSPVYSYLEKLAGFGLITSDFHGIRPYSKAEAARLLREAETNLADRGVEGAASMADNIIAVLRERLSREVALSETPGSAPWFALADPEYGRLRYVYLDGVPRSYFRPVFDPGNDGVFGIGSGLRPPNFYPVSGVGYQRGTEGTPLLENNEGTNYEKWHNTDLRVSLQGYATRYVAFLVEPQFIFSSDNSATTLRINKGYLKVGGGGLEFELGRDTNWFGLGERGTITLTSNPQNLDFIKLSSPEPIDVGLLGNLKYSVLLSRLNETGDVTLTAQQPSFLALKLSLKPVPLMELGINFARQFGGPGGGGFGVLGGTIGDTANSLAGIELRLRFPSLLNTELYGEFSGEDIAGIWPIVESYVAGFYIPWLTVSGHDDFRFEFFYGNQILYMNSLFPRGYTYHNMPIGHSQGGATIDFYTKYRHWFSLETILALEYFHTERGNVGRVQVDSVGIFDPVNGVYQAVERKDSGRVSLNLPLPLLDGLTTNLSYGIERVRNFDLQPGNNRTNQLVKLELNYKY